MAEFAAAAIILTVGIVTYIACKVSDGNYDERNDDE